MINLSKFTEEHISLMMDWINRDYIREYCGDPDETLEEIKEMMCSSWGEPFIIEYQKKPIGYIQCYDCHNEPTQYWNSHVEKGSWGIDIWIGDKGYWGKGVAEEAIKTLSDQLSQREVRSIIVDPHKSNIRAKKFYEKVGFKYIKTLNDHPEGGNELWMKETLK